MGKHFGNIAFVRGIIKYRLSPYEQNPLRGLISKSVPNAFRRFREEVFHVVPPFVGMFMLIKWANKENERSKRKDPNFSAH